MNVRKLAIIGVLALFAAAAADSEAQAFGKRKRNKNNCNTCPQPVQQSCCGSGGYGMAMPTGGVPMAMPMPAGSSVVPAAGSVQPGQSVVPAGGTVPNRGGVIPAGTQGAGIQPGTTYYSNGTYYPNTTYYYDPATNTYYPMNTMNSTTTTPRRGLGLFRR
jgi:hypothetical protein